MTDFRQFPQLDVRAEPDPLRRTVINNAMSGKLNVVQEVTLTASAATTTITDDLITEASDVDLTPQTANAAAALGTTYIPRATITKGSAVIQHANNAQTDRTFTYKVIG